MNDLTKRFESKVRERAAELYGDNLPQTVADRIEEELGYALGSGADALMLAVSDAFREAGLDTEDVYIYNFVGASYLAYLLGVNGGINPLPIHYRCPHCKHSEFDVPEDVRAGLELPEKACPVCGTPMIGEGFDMDSWYFYRPFLGVLGDFSYIIPSEKFVAVLKALQKAEGASDFEQDKMVNMYVWKMRFSSTTLELRTSPTTDQLFRLSTLTGIRPGRIPLGNSADTLAVRETLRQGGSFVGVRELMGRFEEYVLSHFRLKDFYDIVRFSAIRSGSGIWLGNEEMLLKNGTIAQDELPTCREDVFDYLRKYGFDREMAFQYAERIRKGKGFTAEQEDTLRSHGVPMWFIGCCNKILYMAQRSHCISHAITAWRLLYYKMCVDQREFYPVCFWTVENLHCEVYNSIIYDGGRQMSSMLERSMRGSDLPEGFSQEDEYALMVAKEMMECFPGEWGQVLLDGDGVAKTFHVDDSIKGICYIDYLDMMEEKADFVLGFNIAGRVHGYIYEVVLPIDVYVEKESEVLKKEGVFEQHIVSSFKDIPIVSMCGYRVTSEEKTLVDMLQKNGMVKYDTFHAFEDYYNKHGSFDKVEVPEELREAFDRCAYDAMNSAVMVNELLMY